MSTPAETLRAAASLIRETASKAAEGHPTPWHAEPDFNGWWHVATPAPHLVTSAAREPVAEWIALMSPAVAESLAAWLETCANDLADARHYVDEPNSCEHALAFARAILGRAS